MPEKVKESQEQNPRRFNRKQLLSTLTDRAESYRQQVVFNRPDLVASAELVSIATELTAFDDLSPAEQRHLRKMASLRARQQPRVTKTPGDQQFWEILKELVGREWGKAQTFADDLSDLPKSWQSAQHDLLLLSQKISGEA